MKEIEYKVLGVDDLELLVKIRIKDLKMFSNQKITNSTIENIRVFYKEKNLSASHPFQTGKQTDFFLYSATIFCSQTPFLTRANPITHLIRSTDITIK